MASYETISKILMIAVAAYPRFDLKPETVRVYLSMLLDIPDEYLQGSVITHIARSPFFPTVADLRTIALEQMGSAKCQLSGMDAWREVEDQIRMVGHAGTPTFQNQVVERLVHAMGWQNLCRSENHISDRAHFLRAYEQACQQVSKPEFPVGQDLKLSICSDIEKSTGELLPQSQPHDKAK
jgi:hypothetical protein